jgi:hypothetical protein
MSRQVEPPPPPKHHDHQEPTMPVTKMLTTKNLHSTLDGAIIAIALEG